MKIKLGDLRDMIRGAVSSRGQGDGYGIVVASDGVGSKATVYDPSAMEDVILDFAGDFSTLLTATGGELLSMLKGVIVGRVQIVDPGDPCWDAMMIASIAGPGKLMYGVAYALSPSGFLISDRDSMTPQAVSAWRGMSTKRDRDRKKLDDIESPRTPSPVDDCMLHKKETDFLNYAYEAQGWEDAALRTMEAEHDRFVARVTQGGELSRADIERMITSAGFAYFQMRYRKAQV